MQHETIRVKADLNSDYSNLTINLNQTFKFIDILSLRLGSDEIYRLHDANYGVLTGRVLANGGFGIPNAKISIFIPIDETDQQNEVIKTYYNFSSPLQKNNDGIRYNLLTKEKHFKCHTPVGTLSEKNEILDNSLLLEVFDKYYKYTTTTNQSGDYMLIGIPIGVQTIHMDVDLSDIGYVSLRPYDFVAQGYSQKQFISLTKFKGGKDLDSLPQIQTFNTTVDIKPFWGNNKENIIGITQLNFNLPIDITPYAIFFGSIFTDIGAGRVNKKCRPRAKTGRNCHLKPTSGIIEMVRKASDFVDDIEYFPINADIDEDGNWIVLVPMNLERMITDENGNLVPSYDPNIGIPTRTNVRFRINPTYFNYKLFSGLSRTGSFLVPNLYNRFDFGANTHVDDLIELKWKKTYTVRQYIPRYGIRNDDAGQNFIGLKRIGDCEENYPIPYNRLDSDFNPLYTITSVIITIISSVMKIINAIPGVEDRKLSCNGVELPPDEWKECTLNTLADTLNAIDYEFYNDWLTGSLYAPLFSYKNKFKNGIPRFEKYCDFDCREKVGSVPKDLNYKNRCRKSYINDNSQFLDSASNPIASVNRGIIVKHDSIFYYVARFDVEKNPTNTSAELSLTTDEKKYLLFATNIVETGAISDCDIENIPFIIKNLEPTSYQENEEGDILFNIDGLTPNKFNRNAIQLISQIETEQMSDFFDYRLQGNFQNLPEYDTNTDGKTDFVAFDRNNILLRKYLCENQKYFNNVFQYNNTVHNNTNSGSYVMEFDEDDGNLEVVDFNTDNCECLNCNNTVNSPYLKMHPYYFYFGVRKGNNGFDNIIKNYFQDCD